jgi:hypothetical protein
MEFEIGGVYIETYKHPKRGLIKAVRRIICYDEFEILSMDGAANALGIENIRAYTTFYRAPNNSSNLSYEFQYPFPLSAIEKQIYRPDLPLTLANVANLSWHHSCLADEQSLSDFFHHEKPEFLQQIINAPSIMLEQFGKEVGWMAADTIKADNGKYFTVAEVLVKANAITKLFTKKPSHGLGIFRLGFKERLPCYRIGEYVGVASE